MNAELTLLATYYNVNENVIKRCLEETSRDMEVSEEKVLEYISGPLVPKLGLGDLPVEILFDVSLKYLPVEDILRFCQTSKTYKRLCDDEFVWTYLLERDYGIKGVKNPKQEYKSLKSLSTAQKLGVGLGFAVMIDRKGKSWIWGRKWDDSDLSPGLRKLKVSKTAIQVSCRNQNIGIVFSDGYVYGSGHVYKNIAGNTFDPKTNLLKNNNVKQVSVGIDIVGVLTRDNKVLRYISGDRRRKPLGLKKIKITGATAISCGAFHMGAVLENGDLYMWGSNNWKQIGTKASNFVNLPKRVPFHPKIKIASLSCGWEHTGAVTTTGDLYMWGRNNSGQIGDGSTKTRVRPKRVLQKIKQVSCGWDHTGAVTTTGDLYMWGEGIGGQLGFDSQGGYRATPFELAMPEEIRQVSCGKNLTGVITKSFKVYLWGFAKWKKNYLSAVSEHWLHHVMDL